MVFLGTGDFAVPALRAVVAAGHDVVRVISQPDRPAGRGRKIRPTAAHAATEALGLAHIQTEDVNALDVDATFGDAEIGVVAAFGQKIGARILRRMPRGCVNIHGSILPAYRGAAPFQWAMINGEATTGVTVFELNERWDAGPLLATRETPIGETETADELHDRLAELGAGLIVETLARLENGTIEPQAQDPERASRAPKLSRADGTVDFGAPAGRVVRRIHGLWSWPTATVLYRQRAGKEERVQLVRARVVDRETMPTEERPPGGVFPDRTVQAGAGRFELLEVKPAGKGLMPFDAFANGRNLGPGDRFLSLTAEASG